MFTALVTTVSAGCKSETSPGANSDLATIARATAVVVVPPFIPMTSYRETISAAAAAIRCLTSSSLATL